MAKNFITVYHTTEYGNAQSIVSNGWRVETGYRHGQLYGRGIYFWEEIEDAHVFGKRSFGVNNYEIIEEVIPIESGKYDYYEWEQRTPKNSDSDFLSQSLLRRGIKVLIIPKAYIIDTTQRYSKGNAYVWLVDINQDFATIS